MTLHLPVVSGRVYTCDLACATNVTLKRHKVCLYILYIDVSLQIVEDL